MNAASGRKRASNGATRLRLHIVGATNPLLGVRGRLLEGEQQCHHSSDLQFSHLYFLLLQLRAACRRFSTQAKVQGGKRTTRRPTTSWPLARSAPLQKSRRWLVVVPCVLPLSGSSFLWG